MITCLAGDCREVLPTLPEASVDSVVTDPPYHLTNAGGGAHGKASGGFMGVKWDGGDVSFRPETWSAVLRVLKPGGYLLAFGGTRTYHRLVCAIEDAGFEIRDQIGWLYGSGFPKSKDVGNGRGTALKPAFEPIVLARKPLIGTVAANVLAHGTGALNIDGCRIGETKRVPGSLSTTQNSVYGAGLGGYRQDGSESGHNPNIGRWPANIIHDGSDEVLQVFPQSDGQLADASSSSSRKTQNVYGEMKRGNGREGEASADSDNEGTVGFKMRPGARRLDSGSAARFFYTAKASRHDRNEGTGSARNTHPTVKPTDLMRYLCRLVTPPGGTVLDPFLGSGSTLKAAELEGFSAIGIDLDAENVELARARIAGDIPLFAEQLRE